MGQAIQGLGLKLFFLNYNTCVSRHVYKGRMSRRKEAVIDEQQWRVTQALPWQQLAMACACVATAPAPSVCAVLHSMRDEYQWRAFWWDMFADNEVGT